MSFLFKFGQKWVSVEKGVLNTLIIYNHAKKQKRLMKHSWEKFLSWWMDGWADVQKQINNFQQSAFDTDKRWPHFTDFFRATF